jgi:ABC-type antimicrobial peptide transport system permease subunit
VGLYGVISYIVSRRRNEIGIRMALGANRERIAGLVARRLAWIVSTGILIGVCLVWAGIHLLASHDASLAHTPIWLLSAMTLLLLTVMVAAAAIPARRAAKVDPMVALRYE